MARGFTLIELLLAVAIMGVVMAIAVPSFVTISRDLELSKARSDVFGALAAARSRAITSRSLVALHIFRDNDVYNVPRDSTDPSLADYNRCANYVTHPNFLRWGVSPNPASGVPTYGLPHIPTNKMIMRLEVANPDSVHDLNGPTAGSANTNSAIEFYWPADHEPVILPDSLGVCRPQTNLDYSVQTENGRVNAAEDFYIVFAEDGKMASVLIDYDLRLDLTNRILNAIGQTVYTTPTGATVAANPGTWSASGLCLYDMATYKAQPSAADEWTYVNRADNTLMISAYTGMPLSQEATK